jgi:hypothetical protein
MPWFVRYTKSAADHLVQLATPEQAIEAACRLLDDGCDVYGIGTGPFTDLIEKDHIAGIYDLWVRADHARTDHRKAVRSNGLLAGVRARRLALEINRIADGGQYSMASCGQRST